jgi:hypothetical protein
MSKNIIVTRFYITPARSCRTRPPSASPQASAGRAWLAGDLVAF